MNDELSLEEKMGEAFSRSLLLAYATIAPGGTFFNSRDFNFGPAYDDLISGWCDGLVHKYYNRITTGQCSLNAQINFDLAKFEQEVDEAIQTFSALISIFGYPKQLTTEDMRQMGYRGSWAGYTKEEDERFYFERDQKDLAEVKQQLEDHKKLPKNKQNHDMIYHLERDIRHYQSKIQEYTSKVPLDLPE